MRSLGKPDPDRIAAVLAFRGQHPICGELRYEQVRQDRRTYYRYGCQLTTLEQAEQCIAYWQAKGWETPLGD